MLFSSSWFEKHEDYGGAVLQDSPTPLGFKTWGESKGLSIKYNNDVPNTPHYTGKFYFLSRKLSEYVLGHGEELAIRHAENLGGSEDTFIGRMVGQYVGDANWPRTRSSWKNDYLKSLRTQPRKVISSNGNLIELPGEMDIKDKLVIMSARWKRDDIAFAKYANLATSTLVYGGRRGSDRHKDSPLLDYFDYIISNYHDLPKCMVFVNDELFAQVGARTNLSQGKLFQFIRKAPQLSGFLNYSSARQYPSDADLKVFKNTWNTYVPTTDLPTYFKGGPIFGVTGERVLSKPKSWYCSMRRAISSGDPTFVHVLGCSLHRVFGENMTTKNYKNS
jgi:hypothetical protein